MADVLLSTTYAAVSRSGWDMDWPTSAALYFNSIGNNVAKVFTGFPLLSVMAMLKIVPLGLNWDGPPGMATCGLGWTVTETWPDGRFDNVASVSRMAAFPASTIAPVEVEI